MQRDRNEGNKELAKLSYYMMKSKERVLPMQPQLCFAALQKIKHIFCNAALKSSPVANFYLIDREGKRLPFPFLQLSLTVSNTVN